MARPVRLVAITLLRQGMAGSRKHWELRESVYNWATASLISSSVTSDDR